MLKRRMYMFDYARLRSFHKGEFICLLALLTKLGYKELGLYVEGAFLPAGKQGAVREEVLTPADAQWIRTEAEKHGMTVLPMTNVLCHMEHFLCQERYAHLRRHGPNERYLINFEDPDAIPFAMDIIRSLAEMFRTDTIQIGLDEFPFRPEEVPAIGDYIRAVTEQMLAEGLTPAIWGDMLWMEQSLTAYLPRVTEIHDWNYYGHRRESLRYFREEGFRQVIAVPSDNGWEGFTGCQRVTGHLRSRTDIPVEPGEIEAFLSDAAEEKADGGMIANWENNVGRSVWAALVPAARAGLWMQGKWDGAISEEEQVETALFGRITPYTRIVQRLRKLQMHTASKCHIRLPQDALYRLESMQSLLNRPAGFWTDTIALYEEALPEMGNALDSWVPANTTEIYVRDAIRSVVTNVRAACRLMRFSQSGTLYRQAALAQFSDPQVFGSNLGEVEAVLEEAIRGMQESRQARKHSIAETGITRQDILWQERLIEYLQNRKQKLREWAADTDSRTALQTFTEFLYCWEFGVGGYVPQ